MGPTMYSLLCLAVLVGIPATGWAQTIAPSLTELSGRVKPGDTVYVTESSQPVKGKLCRMAEKAKPSNWATAGVLHSLLEGLGAVGSVAMLIRNRRRPGVSLRRTGLVSFFGLMLLAPSQGSAQALQSFE